MQRDGWVYRGEDTNSLNRTASRTALRRRCFLFRWYSYNNYPDAFTWNTGAIGFHLDSSSAADPRVAQTGPLSPCKKA